MNGRANREPQLLQVAGKESEGPLLTIIAIVIGASICSAIISTNINGFVQHFISAISPK